MMMVVACRFPDRSSAPSRFANAALRRGAVALLGLLVALGAFAQQPLVIATSKNSLSLPLYVAEAQGYFAAEGVAARLDECLGGVRCIRQMFAGDAHIATASDLPVMFNGFERSDFAVIATFVTSEQDTKLVTRRSAGITTAAQLEGRRVGTVKGASAQYFLDTWLLFNGVDPKRVNVVPLAPEQAPGALERREVDAIAVWEPHAFVAMKMLGADGLVLPAPRVYTQTFNLVASRKALAEREPDIVKLLRALLRAERFIRERPRDAQALLMAKLKLGPEFIEWDWRNHDFRLALSPSLLSTLDGEARWAQREGHVPAGQPRPNYLRLVEPGPLLKVAPAAVTLVK